MLAPQAQGARIGATQPSWLFRAPTSCAQPMSKKESCVTIARTASNQQGRGISFVLLGMTLFSIQDVIMKLISGGYPIHQLVALRSVITLLLLLGAAYHYGGWGQLRTRRLGTHLGRGLLMLLSYTAYYLAIAALPLADAIALYFVSPLFVTVLSGVILKEPIGGRQWAALICGFVGMLAILRPGTAVFQPVALLSLLAALAYAASVIQNRQLASSESGLALAIYSTAVYLAAAVVAGIFWGRGITIESQHPSLQFLTRAWIWPSPTDFGLIAVTGLIAAISFYSLAQAYRIAPVSTVAPFEYVMLLMGVIWGFVFWHELPDQLTAIGMALVVCSGLILLPRRKRTPEPLVYATGES